MAVHVPITDAAKKEAKEKLMPSQNLLNPTNNSIIMDLKHEMQLGIYYMTRDRLPNGSPKDFKNAGELRKAYELGEVQTYDAVRMNVPRHGTVTSTAGKHLFNSVLPPAYIDFKKNENMKKKDIEAILFAVMEDNRLGPMRAVQIINELKNLGFKSSTMSAISIGVRDFDPIANIDKDKLFSEAEKVPSVAKHIDDREEFENEKAKFVENRIGQIINEGVLTSTDPNNPVEIMRISGARGNTGQISAMSALVGTGADVTSRAIRPIKSSLLEGARPDEFWDLSNDARKGIYDRSVATQGPGELTRYVWLANKQTVVSEADCGDTQGIMLNLNKESDSKALSGRILLAPVELKNGGAIQPKRKEPLSRSEVDKIRNEVKDKTSIRVRSPLTCKTTSGICQLCYGTKPGGVGNELVPIGEAVGSIAAQALGEPSQQAIMKTFHTGAGDSKLSDSFSQIRRALSLSTIPNKSVLATDDGVVTDITSDILRGTTISVGRKKYNLGKLEMADGVRIGVDVKRGQPLTKEYDHVNNEWLSIRDPKEVLEYEGVDAAKAYLTDQIERAFKSGDISDIDRRHTEVVVSNMTNRAVVNSGGTTDVSTGEKAPLKSLESYNRARRRIVEAPLDYSNRTNVIGAISAENYHERLGRMGPVIVKKGEPITEQAWEKLRATNRKFIKVQKANVDFTPELQGVEENTFQMGENRLEHAARGNAGLVLGKGTAGFMEDKLDNPLTRQMTGLKGNFGDGFTEWASDMKSKFGNMFV